MTARIGDTSDVSSHAADPYEFQFRSLTEDEKKEFMNIHETSKELSADVSNEMVDDDSSRLLDEKWEEVVQDNNEEILAALREKSSDDFAIGPRSDGQLLEDVNPDEKQPDQAFSNFATEEVLNRGVGNVHAVRPILWLFPLVATLLLVTLVTVAFKATDQLWLPTNSMTSNERSQTVGFQSNGDRALSSRELVEASIRSAREPSAAAVVSLPAPNDVAGSADSTNRVAANPAKSLRQRHSPSRVAIYHRSQRAWHAPKRSVRFNAIY